MATRRRGGSPTSSGAGLVRGLRDLGAALGVVDHAAPGHWEGTRRWAATGLRAYFCDPRSPWRRGTNENTNRLLRQFFSKGIEFADVTGEESAKPRTCSKEGCGRP